MILLLGCTVAADINSEERVAASSYDPGTDNSDSSTQ